MLNTIFFEDGTRTALYPLTYTRPVCEIRIGILTIREKWERLLQARSSFLTSPYLQEKFPLVTEQQNLLINGSILPTFALCEEIKRLKPHEVLVEGETPIAMKLDAAGVQAIQQGGFPDGVTTVATEQRFLKIDHLWDIFRLNDQALRADFAMLTRGRESRPISPTNQVMGRENIFLEEGAKVECSILNATGGPIYLAREAEIMEGSLVRGGLALCEHAALKMGAKIYGATTLGPHCKVGGEVGNSVFQGYSNKGHDGYLGNSVIGEWCNLGADTNSSNLKNNYAEVKLWNYATESTEPTGQQFLGLIMGDHAKCGINTMFNTGTVVGVASNVFGGDFPPNFIPSFSWGGAAGLETFRLDKAFEVAERMMERRGQELTADDRAVLTHIFQEDARFRS
jgi:UDP-N-acetylglucosamine diphosphorylase/glucosamine-1-phosphate N-acetyltransferase